jgi:heat shock protein HslJ
MITHRSITAGLALILLMAIGAGCSAAASPQLAGRAFLSVAVTDGGADRPLVAGTRIRLDFRGTDLGASAGCNSIGGTWSTQGGKLVFDGASMTEMGCDDARHAQDDWLVELLGSRPTIRLNGNELTLESGTIVVRLLDREVVEPDLVLVGPTWTVESIITGDAVSSIPGGAVATLVFKGDGTVDINAGCNRGGATWTAVGGGLKVENIGLTKMACEGPGGQLESAVIEVLGAGTIGASIDASVLTLRSGANGLQLRAG